MTGNGHREADKKLSIVNVTLAIVACQVGFLTLVIVLGAILGGLWLDNRFHTRPTITIVLLLVSIPISVFVMLAVVRSAVARIKASEKKVNEIQSEEEPGIGTDTDS